MIKKSAILALLEGFPDEVEETSFLEAFDDLREPPPLTEAQKAAVIQTAERIKREGSQPIEEVEARFEAWAATFE